MAADERWGNLYLYGCTVGALRFIAQTSQPTVRYRRGGSLPFGCGAVASAKHEVYLINRAHRSHLQVHHRHEGRIS